MKAKEIVFMNGNVQRKVWIVSWIDNRAVNMLTTFKPYWQDATRNGKDPNNHYVRITLHRPNFVKFYNAGMGGTDSEDHKLALYRTSVHTRKWPHRILFHFLLASVLNAHILYRLKYNTEGDHPFHEVGDWIEAAAIQMKEIGSTATRTARTRAAAAVPADVVKIANGKCHWTTWDKCPSRLTPGHFSVSYPQSHDDTNRRRCKMPDCRTKVQVYCRNAKFHYVLLIQMGLTFLKNFTVCSTCIPIHRTH
jgi:hypothetical protein